VENKMSSTQESDSWFGSSRWKTALYVGLPLLCVGVVGVLLWRRHSVKDTTSEPRTEQPADKDVTTPAPELVWKYYFYFVQFRKRCVLFS
jgi:hypothetical protein